MRAVALSLCLHLALLSWLQFVPVRQGYATVVIDARIQALPQALKTNVVTPVETPKLAVPEDMVSKQTDTRHEPPDVTSHDVTPAEALQAANAPSKSEPAESPALAMPALVDMTWHGARDVDSLPFAKGKIEPVYPESARRRGQSGSVRLRLKIESSGDVVEVLVVESIPPGVFDAAAVAAFEKAKFEPARKAGSPVRYEGEFRVGFELSN